MSSEMKKALQELEPTKTTQPQQVIEKVIYIERQSSYGMAALLTFFIPGLGQIIKGHLLAGIGGFFLTTAGYFFFIIPGLIMHILMIADAYHSKSKC